MFLAALALVLTAGASNAAVVIYSWEENGVLQSSFSGTLDLTGLTRVPQADLSYEQAYIQADGTYFMSIPGNYDAWDGVTVTGSIGSSSTKYEGSRAGDGLGYLTDTGRIYLAETFVAGSFFSGTMSIAGLTLADLGVTSPTTVTLSWDSDSITHYWGTAPSAAVPVPAGLPLAVTAFGALFWLRRSRREEV